MVWSFNCKLRRYVYLWDKYNNADNARQRSFNAGLLIRIGGRIYEV